MAKGLEEGVVTETDLAVVGGGSGGYSTALEAADKGHKVDLFAKGATYEDSNSNLIAGGLAAVPLINGKPLKGDSFDLHVQNTLEAGASLNNEAVVRYCVEHFFPDVIQWSIDKGVQFDESKGGYRYDLHKEGGHNNPKDGSPIHRVFHKSDATGAEIMQTLDALVEAHPNITVHREHMAIDLITRNSLVRRGKLKGSQTKRDKCYGFYAYDIKKDVVRTVQAKGTIVATGGLGRVFLVTSNPDVATGDGFAMCYRAGLPLAMMGFIQFHPTVYYDPQAGEAGRNVLFTEALRGAGAKLKLHKDDKEDFVLKYHKLGSNADRATVTIAEDKAMTSHKPRLDNVWLDCTAIPKEKLKKEFKDFWEFCKSKGIDPTKESVPVTYGAHYSNGGVLVGRHGETLYADGSGLENCWVVGETAYTGLHGATRLASNSGPEAILYGRLAAQHFSEINKQHNINIPLWEIPKKAKEPLDEYVRSYYWRTVRRTMTELCGISRNDKRLAAAQVALSAIWKHVHNDYWNHHVDKDFLEIRNILYNANVILESARFNKRTIACQSREDFPGVYGGWDIVQKGKEPYIIKVPNGLFNEVPLCRK